MTNFNISQIDEAYRRIQSFIVKTPLIYSEYLNNITRAKVFFKLENLQRTGSFKLRGATNKIIQLTIEEKKEVSLHIHLVIMLRQLLMLRLKQTLSLQL